MVLAAQVLSEIMIIVNNKTRNTNSPAYIGKLTPSTCVIHVLLMENYIMYDLNTPYVSRIETRVRKYGKLPQT